MDQETATEKVWKLLEDQKLVILGLKHIYTDFFNQLYAIGYNEGSRSRSNKKSVIQMDKYGNVINVFDSIASANRKTKIDSGDIVKCCKSQKNSAGGFHWKYESTSER
jgi:hypothetical protein